MIEIITVLFLIADPFGNLPIIVGLLKEIPQKRQKFVLLRETGLALLISLFFQFFGEYFLALLNIELYTVSLAGGVLIFLVALGMIFPSHREKRAVHKEPFLFPIATPLLAGPGVLVMIMLYSRQFESILTITYAIIITWVLVGSILLLAPFILAILRKKGMRTMEQLMGLMLLLIAVQMTINGVTDAFFK